MAPIRFGLSLAALTLSLTACGSPALASALDATRIAGTSVISHGEVLDFATPAATAAPTPQATPRPTMAPRQTQAAHTAAVDPQPVQAASPASNYLTSDDGSLHTGVGTYSDCSGRTPLQRNEAAIDSCISGPTYFLGHNYGVFTPLMHMNVGDHITYLDGSGQQHRFRIVSRRDWVAANGVPQPTEDDVAAQFQTCIKPDGSLDRILDVVEE